MINGRTLLDHEQINGLTHPPWRDLDDWAEEINRNEGHCLSHPERSCPCPESIEEINMAPDGEHAVCSCMMFCDDRHIEYLKEKGQIQDQNGPRPKKEPVVIDIESMHNKKLKDIVTMFDDSIELIKKGEPWKAVPLIEAELEKEQKRVESGGGCDLCKTYLEESLARASMVDRTCDADTAACKIDTARTLNRFEELKILHYEVDKSLVENPPKLDEIAPKDRTFKTDFHRCQSNVMKHPAVKSAVPDQHKRMGVASSYCAGKVKDINEAISLANQGGKQDG